MCTGLEIAAIAAGAAGNAIQADQQRKYQEQQVAASNSRLNQFLDRNKQREADAQAIFDKRTSESEQPQAVALRDKAVADRTAEITQAADSAVAGPPAPLKGSAATVIGDVFDGERAKAAEAANSRATALGRTAGFGDAIFNQGVANVDAGRKIGTIGTLARDDASMLPTYQDLAMAQIKRPGGIGSILAALGQGAGMYAGSKAGPI